MAPKLGIIAGGLDLPKKVIAHCRQIGRPFFVLALEGQTDPQTVDSTDHAWISLGGIGKALKLLHQADVKELIMVGPVKRPSLTSLWPDLVGAKWIGKFLKHKALGDDQLLSLIAQELEGEGFKIVGTKDVLQQETFISEGLLGSHRPDVQAQRDIQLGIKVARTLGQVDVGQAVIVQQGTVLAVEAIEGTKAMLRRTDGLILPGAKPVLVKIAKPGQDRRFDLPTIGPATVALAGEIGLAGIALEADLVQVIDIEKVRADADQAGIFIEGLRLDD